MPIQQGTPRMRSASFRDREHEEEDAGGAEVDALAEMARDPVLCRFVSEDFNATQFASDALRSGSAAASAEKVEQGMALLEKQLRREVVLRHSELVQQLSSVKDMEGALGVVKIGVGSLENSVRRVRSEVAEPYKSIRSKSTQLSSLHTTVELLRAVVRVLKQLKRLRELVVDSSKPTDLSKAAQLWSEIDGLRSDADLSGIEVVDSELAWLKEAGTKIRSEAMRSLEAGMKAFNQAQVGAALQVYFNLGELRPTVESVIQKYKSQAVKSIASALDMKAISASVAAAATGPAGPGGAHRSGTPQLGAGSRARDGLWQRLGQCMEQLHSILVAVWHLERVMIKKRDPVSHASFIDEVVQAGDASLTERVWEAIVKAFASQMKSAFTSSSFVKEIFVLGYPKLLGVADNFLQRLVRDTEVKGASPAIKDADRQQLVTTLEPFQNAYLGQTLARLTDLVNNMFASSTLLRLPTSEEPIAKLVARIQEEVEAAKLDARLTLMVLKEVGKSVQLFAEKAEYQLATGPDARQVTGPATPSQLKNFALCHHLQDVHHRLSSMLTGLSPSAADILSPSLGAVYGVAVDTVNPLFKAMAERLEKSILEMQGLDFNSDMTVDDERPKYMQEIQEAATHFRSEFLSKLLTGSSSGNPKSVSINFVRKMASRVLVLFVRHAALVRPLSEAGKLSMARDMAELELLVAQNLFPVEQLGAPYRALRAFRPFIFLETNQIASSPLLQELPASVVFHHLYSRAPDELESPMKRSKLSASQYSLWLDTHSEQDVWKEVKGTLDDYAAKVRARGDKQFTPIYPLMLQLGSSLL
ncbi:conserved oligomeric Golgi complex subunit 5 [Selaginella moellendorffii]|nr:conserved oligomeric Golgi complex subunit 5 [Selaginella moellendorffii]|eukprot:XP_002985481.2 conserved oligomeric Golgi complex subunit 5 [Selaginella moellendorffii]